MAATNWQSETVDEILDTGDSQFLDALQRGFIPDAPNLSVEQLPTIVCFARSNDHNSDLPIVAPNEISKPILVLPLVATKANTPEAPIEAPKNSDFPIMERKSESPIVVIKNEVPIVATKIDHRLTFDDHTSNLCRKAAAQLNALKRRVKGYLDFKTKEILVQSFVFSNFNYCPLVWHFSSEKSVKKIEKIHERALRFLYNDSTSSYEDLLSKAKKCFIASVTTEQFHGFVLSNLRILRMP